MIIETLRLTRFLAAGNDAEIGATAQHLLLRLRLPLLHRTPASRQAAKPPARWATGFRPMSWAVFAASAERMPPAQWKTNFLSSWKIGFA